MRYLQHYWTDYSTNFHEQKARRAEAWSQETSRERDRERIHGELIDGLEQRAARRS
jgi:hypothetical protein